MNKNMNATPPHPNFESQVSSSFAFLTKLGYVEIESLPTLVRYKKEDVELDIYYGRSSYEIGAGISYDGTRYALGEIIRITDVDASKRYRNFATTTAGGIALALSELSLLMERYGMNALKGDPQVFMALDSQRKIWSEEYALDVLAEQLRPQAEDSFRTGDYAKAAELYNRIRGRLTPVEVKKLMVAEDRMHGKELPG